MRRGEMRIVRATINRLGWPEPENMTELLYDNKNICCICKYTQCKHVSYCTYVYVPLIYNKATVLYV